MNDSLILDWLNVGLRWVHVIAGIGWIGTSLYFMWLDAALIRSDPPRSKVEGHAWLLHSGGFYLVERRKLPPGQLPSPIHWFKWEAGMTFLTGFPLLVLVYYMTGGVYLVDPAAVGDRRRCRAPRRRVGRVRLAVDLAARAWPRPCRDRRVVGAAVRR